MVRVISIALWCASGASEMMRSVLLHVDAHLVHDRHHEGVGFARPHAAGLDIDLVAVEMPHQVFRHGRADDILAAREEDRARQV
jgi:hypothetical protein